MSHCTKQEICYRTPITTNAFKSPVEIHEPGHDRISFQYNDALGRSHIYYGGEQADPLARRYHKHYAEDGSAEITKDTQTGEVSFVLYLGGDAYSAPAIRKETMGGTGPASNDLYFLHRDYLGSIVMITDSLANIMEKRHFDAWGNIVGLADGNDNNLTNFVILDGRYTEDWAQESGVVVRVQIRGSTNTIFIYKI